MKDWEIIADNLSKAGWSWGCVSAIDREGRTIWIADAHRDNGKRFVVHANTDGDTASNTYADSNCNAICYSNPDSDTEHDSVLPTTATPRPTPTPAATGKPTPSLNPTAKPTHTTTQAPTPTLPLTPTRQTTYHQRK